MENTSLTIMDTKHECNGQKLKETGWLVQGQKNWKIEAVLDFFWSNFPDVIQAVKDVAEQEN